MLQKIFNEYVRGDDLAGGVVFMPFFSVTKTPPKLAGEDVCATAASGVAP